MFCGAEFCADCGGVFMKTLVIAPHPDDELLGCGGSLLRKKAEGDELAWLIVTGMTEEDGWSRERILERDSEIDQVSKTVGFSMVYNLRMPIAALEMHPIGDLIGRFSLVFKEFQPDEVWLPHYSDVHTDHKIVFDVASACTKWFRYPSVRRVLAYETISETDFGLKPNEIFCPNVFIDISEYIDKKMNLLAVYKSELGDFPFPRSDKAIRALATLRGAASGYEAAEAFQLLRERG